MRYRLRTLLIVLALGPIVGAWGFRAVEEHVRYRRTRDMRDELSKISNPPWPGHRLMVRPASAGMDDAAKVDPTFPE